MPFIGSYTRKDGTQVRAHSRSAPGAKRELSILAGVVLAAWALTAGHVHVTVTTPKAPAVRTQVTAPAHPGSGR